MFDFFKKGLEKTVAAIKNVIPKQDHTQTIQKDLLEEILLESDVTYENVEEIIYYLPPSKDVKRADLRRVLLSQFTQIENDKKLVSSPCVEVIIGVNGAGKTTTIAKLAQKYKNEGKKVMLGAGDTFRAAAIEQLKGWSQRLDVPIIFTKQGHDPSAVAYDAIESAKAKGFDNVIIDTAGRLHNSANLSGELKKIVRICDKAKSGSPDRTILILDGTQGNCAIAQARAFDEIVGIDGVIVTKLDGTAKGGAIFSIAKELKKPIFYIGVGEKSEDLIEFESEKFVDSLLDGIFQD